MRARDYLVFRITLFRILLPPGLINKDISPILSVAESNLLFFPLLRSHLACRSMISLLLSPGPAIHTFQINLPTCLLLVNVIRVKLNCKLEFQSRDGKINRNALIHGHMSELAKLNILIFEWMLYVCLQHIDGCQCALVKTSMAEEYHISSHSNF